MYYPKIISWLASGKARLALLKRCHKKAQKKSLLPSIKRDLSLYELAIVTRAGQAKSLGLESKGHLGVGADADVSIYNVNPETTDISNDYALLEKAFDSAAYTIKDGIVVVKDGKIVQTVDGKTMWLDVNISEQVKVDDDMKRRFKEYWTVEYDNYPVFDHYVKVSDPIAVKASV
jgi:formylmethanofuran dehydrogenase subunit A